MTESKSTVKKTSSEPAPAATATPAVDAEPRAATLPAEPTTMVITTNTKDYMGRALNNIATAAKDYAGRSVITGALDYMGRGTVA